MAATGRFTQKRVADGVYKRTFGGGGVTYKAVAPASLGPDGKRRPQASKTFKTKPEAVAWRDTVRGERPVGIERPTGLRTLREYLDAWLADPPTNIQPNTLAQYRWALTRHVPASLEQAKLRSLSAAAFERATWPPEKASYVHAALHRALRDAPLPRHPMAGVRKPRQSSVERTPWTEAEYRRWLAVADADRYAALWRVLGQTGLRRGEVLGLDWSDIDLSAGTVSARRQFTFEPCAEGGRALVLKDLKTGARSHRIIDIDAATVAALAAWRDVQRATCARRIGRDAGAVFTHLDGRRIGPKWMSQRFRDLVAAAGVPAQTIHDVRHVHATLLLRGGVPVHVVSRRLGHASPVVTLTIYAHVLPDQSRLAADVAASIAGG